MQTATITATSAVNSGVTAQMQLVVYPSGTIRIAPGLTSDYVDSGGNTWFSGPLAGSDASESFLSEPQYGQDNGGSWSGTTNIDLYKRPIYATGDMRFDIVVPNGTYQVTAKLANNSSGGGDNGNFLVETQGVASGVVDVFNLVGNNAPYDVTQTGVVQNHHLSIVLRNANATGGGYGPFISALQVIPLTITGETSPPAAPAGLQVIQVN